MKRRDFALTAAAAATLAALPAAFAQGQPFTPKEGENYLVVNPAAPVDTSAGKVEVVEFFSYGCPHCRDFEPIFEKWAAAQPQDVVVRRMHVGFSNAFEPLQRIFFALEAMGLNEKVHTEVFNAILNEKKRLNTLAEVQPWMTERGVDGAKFAAAYKSFGVASKIRRAIELQDAYHVEATPSFGIAGRYYMDPGMTNGFDGMLKTADALIAKLRKSGGQ